MSLLDTEKFVRGSLELYSHHLGPVHALLREVEKYGQADLLYHGQPGHPCFDGLASAFLMVRLLRARGVRVRSICEVHHDPKSPLFKDVLPPDAFTPTIWLDIVPTQLSTRSCSAPPALLPLYFVVDHHEDPVDPRRVTRGVACQEVPLGVCGLLLAYALSSGALSLGGRLVEMLAFVALNDRWNCDPALGVLDTDPRDVVGYAESLYVGTSVENFGSFLVSLDAGPVRAFAQARHREVALAWGAFEASPRLLDEESRVLVANVPYRRSQDLCRFLEAWPGALAEVADFLLFVDLKAAPAATCSQAFRARVRQARAGAGNCAEVARAISPSGGGAKAAAGTVVLLNPEEVHFLLQKKGGLRLLSKPLAQGRRFA